MRFLFWCLFLSVLTDGVIAVNAAANTTYELFGNGVNFQPSYYCSGDQDMGWKLLSSYPKINSVRIELQTGDCCSVDVPDFSRWISEAQKEGKTVIATYHRFEYLGSNDPTYLIEAGNWWKDNYQALGGNFYINIMNEWADHTISASDFANAYNQAIALIREVYPLSLPLIIDIPGWGQEFYTAAKASPLIKDKNIIFSAHIYPQSYDSATDSFPTSKNVDHLNAAGRPCMFGEFGSSDSTTSNWSDLVSYGKSLGWSAIGWAWNGDGGVMNMASPSWTESCSTSDYVPSSYFNTIYDIL
jgi:mannan endo-1,4-beta-mannosidase